MHLQTYFADILLPLPLKGYFTYRVPFELNDEVQVGRRVVVQFGQRKIYTGLIRRIHEQVPSTPNIKYVLAVLDDAPVVTENQFEFWEWLANYYMCYVGEVMNAALPSALKLASESKVVFHPEFDGNFDVLTDKEFLVAEALEVQKVLTVTEVSKIVDQLKVIPLIKTMIEKKVVLLEEEIKDRYKPKEEKFVRINDEYKDEKKLGEVFDQLQKRAFKQLEIVMAYIQLSDFYNPDGSKEVSKQKLLSTAKADNTALKGLEKKGILEVYSKVVSRLKEFNNLESPDSIKFSEDQQNAFDNVRKGFELNKPVLLHGVTSSGKTEIYIQLINEVIKQGKQVLYLLPEIALTTQIINRLRKYFGDQVGVYHSRYNEFERVEIWNRVLNDQLSESSPQKPYQIILGARSSMFLPFENLGLIIVDEEHDYSYKQIDPAPRYNARDAAVYLALKHQAKILMGSATPCIESYYNAKNEKYHLVELFKRYGGIQLPEIQVADIKDESKKRKMKSMFSSLLIQNIDEAIERKEQIILFQNRRGFSTRIECNKCNWVPTCKNCDVSLTYHKKINLLKCHYCGYSTPVPEDCPSCGHKEVFMHGFGTEKIEEELSLIYPDLSIRRMDLDTTRSKHAYQHIIQEFEERKIDILVGTQMITKGLDFDNVSIVGIMNADNMISFPDFRSFERSFQMLAQVSGRAGRKNKRGKVIIQSFNPYHSVIRYVIDNNFDEMYKSQILERRNFKYPPFYRLIYIRLKHRDADFLNKASWRIGDVLRRDFGNLILGPEYPLVGRISNFYIKQILVKVPRNQHLGEFKKRLNQYVENFRADTDLRKLIIQMDVDPL